MTRTAPRTAVVTGSTSGIGEGIARALAAAGNNVVINGFGDAAAIETLRATIAAENKVECLYSSADMTRPDQIEAMFAMTKEKLGPVDILVNNAGVQHVSPVEDFPIAKWDLIIALNLSSAFHTTRLAFPDMKASKWGRIINIASAHALVASPFKSAYVAAKHGILGFTKSTALEGATHCIRVNGLIDRIPQRRIGQPEHLDGALLLLASEAGSFMTGSVITVDGGHTVNSL